MERLEIHVTEEQKKWLKKQSYEKDKSIAEIIREVIEHKIRVGE